MNDVRDLVTQTKSENTQCVSASETGKLFVVGDTHGDIDSEKLSDENFPEQSELTKDDVVAQMGDFGWIFHPLGSNDIQNKGLSWLASRNYTLVVVPGNHENYFEIFNLPIIEKWGGKVRVLSLPEGDIFFLERGEVYTINGKTIFVFGGALSVDNAERTLGIDYWKEEIPTWSEFNYGMDSLDKVNWKVDYVFTHTCPMNIIGDVIHKTIYTEGRFKDPVSEYLFEIYKQIEFVEWHFGHFHTDVRLDYSDTDDGIFHCHYNNKPFLISV